MEYEKELDEVLAAFARLQINGAQELADSKRRFLMLMRDDKAIAVAAERAKMLRHAEIAQSLCSDPVEALRVYCAA